MRSAVACVVLLLVTCSVSATGTPSYPTHQLSVNIVDLFWCYGLTESTPPSQAKKAMTDAVAAGFTYFRFAATPFWPIQLDTYFSNETLYWAQFDQLVADAESLNAQLIPSVFWNMFLFADVNKEPLSEMFNQGSATWTAMQSYTEKLVTRYHTRHGILFWEVGNEFNLLADLNLEQQNPLIAPSLGTPTHRTLADNFTTDMMIDFGTMFTGWVRAIDSTRPISTGYALPRAQAQHLRESYYKPNRDWRNDSPEEFAQNLDDISTSFDLISVHYYADPSNSRYGQWSADSNGMLNFTKDVADSIGKPLYLGEYGSNYNTSLPNNGMDFSLGVLESIVGKGIFTSTLWIWEFYQSGLSQPPAQFSLIPGRDSLMISAMQEANRALGEYNE